MRDFGEMDGEQTKASAGGRAAGLTESPSFLLSRAVRNGANPAERVLFLNDPRNNNVRNPLRKNSFDFYAAASILFAIALLSSSSGMSRSDAVLNGIEKLVEQGSVLLNDEEGNTLVSIDADRPLVPASIIKILTASIALDILGSDFRFKTECFLDSDGNLTIRGYGDPYFISDEIRLFARQLKEKRIYSLNRISLEHSFFSNDCTIPGISETNNPYDALNGALVVNFNTINIGKDAAGKVFSAEKETPLTPLAAMKARAIAPGTKALRINLSAERSDCNDYAGDLLLTIFREQGITVADSIIGISPGVTGGEPFLTYTNSRTLPDVLRGLLQFSNNFIANQIFLVIGAMESDEPASMQKSRMVFERYIRRELKIPESGLVMVEGSGISRENRVTGRVMMSILERFKPQAGLLTPKNGHPVKSGTLKNVSNYAGYIKTERGLRSFVIMLNQEKNYRDSIMKLLEKYP